MSCPCEAAEAGASSLATPKRMLLGVLALLLISAVVVGVVLKLQSPQVPSGRVTGPALAHLMDPITSKHALIGAASIQALPLSFVKPIEADSRT